MHQNLFNENFFMTILHPPDSPELAPSNFWLFGDIRTSLAGCAFSDVDELLEAVIEFSNEVQPSQLQYVFHH
jgi:hypothetical protein